MNEVPENFFGFLRNPHIVEADHRDFLIDIYNFSNPSQQLINESIEIHQNSIIFEKFSEFTLANNEVQPLLHVMNGPLDNILQKIKTIWIDRDIADHIAMDQNIGNHAHEEARYQDYQQWSNELFNDGENIKIEIFDWLENNNFEIRQNGRIMKVNEAMIDNQIADRLDWQVELGLSKPISLISKLEINKRSFNLQPKLYFNKRSLGVRLDLFDNQCTNPSILLKYKNYMVGFQNHKNQSHMVIGKNILSHDQVGTININGLLAVTSNKEKFLETSKFNVDVYKNLIKQEFLNLNSSKILSKDIGFQSKCIVNLFSFEKKKKKLNKLSIESPKKHVQANVKTLSLSQNENSLQNQNFNELSLIFPKFREARHSNSNWDDFNLNESIRPIQTIALDPYPSKLNGSESVASVSIGAAFFIIVVSPIVHFIKTRVFDKPC